MLAQVTDMEPYEFIWTTGDTHIYFNQLDNVDIQLQREPQPLPKLWLNPDVTSLFEFTLDDIKILDYYPLEEIKYEVAR
jgi:thymidylate synthase